MPTQNPNMLDYCPSCDSYNLVESLESATSIHYGRLTCNDCQRFVRWLPKPKVPEISVARLLNSTGLQKWERRFLKIVVSRNRSKAEEIVVAAIQAKVNPVPCGRGTG